MKRKFVVPVVLLTMLLLSNTSLSFSKEIIIDDFDPLVDISVTVEIKAIRFLEDNLEKSLEIPKFKTRILSFRSLPKIFRGMAEDNDEPNFYIKVYINNKEIVSDIWHSSKYIYTSWKATVDVPDDKEFVNIKIQLLDSITGISYDISGEQNKNDIELVYSIKTGKWSGDDYIGDPSGYGRVSGCDDGSIYVNESDCELWFDIYQVDYDGDKIPYWAEINVINTNPKVNDFLSDPDKDNISTYWEWRWGYDPLVWNDHKTIDPDGDSIDNYEEYLTFQWFSDPFRKDVFVELDIMEDGPNGEKVYFPKESQELLNTAFDRRNIVFHLDYGEMGGHEKIPFDDLSNWEKMQKVYQYYFLHNNSSNWRRGVFHYGVVAYNSEGAPGWMFRSNAFQIASFGTENYVKKYRWLDRNIAYASVYMHELGHTFNFNPIPGHNKWSMYPWQPGYWINRPYKSCMNYGWTYTLVDYSDGSRKSPDINDWGRIDYSFFESEWR